MTKKFATAVNCIDGRAHKPVAEYLQEKFCVDYVDMITEPGPSKILSDNDNAAIVESIKKRVAISVERHNSDIIAIAAHHDCAGNPENDDVQKEQLLDAIKTVFLWGFPVKNIIAIWLDESFRPNLIIEE